MSSAPDQAARDRAVAAGRRNVLIDAGAGAGKTSILVARILELVAPRDDSAPALSLGRIAAVTFTRRAAGELRLRVREAVLRGLGRPDLTATRRRRLLDALGAVDAAPLTTIHGFADRLLRLQPMKAKLSPLYQIAEDLEPLVDETFKLLLHAVQSGTLAAELGDLDPAYVAEVARTFQEALRAGLLVNTIERDPIPPKIGLDLLVRAFIEHRDRELAWETATPFDQPRFAAATQQLIALMEGVTDDGYPGTRWLIGLRDYFIRYPELADPLAAFDLIARIWVGRNRFKKTKHFAKKSAAQAAWSVFEKGLDVEILAPIQQAVTHRLARTRHAIVRLYEHVKARNEAIDSIDLLLMLRDVLRDDLDARAFYQGLFDHILVDELQDTDPLQAEIVLYLAERTPHATRWQDVEVHPERVTLVGDPKQSIYRFRRADVGMYERLCAQVARSSHEALTLTANFRTRRPLVEWANARFAAILGVDPDGRAFNPATGDVFHQPQVPVRAADVPGVHAVPYSLPDGDATTAGPARVLEGRALTAYLHWLVERSGFEIEDPDTHVARRVRWSDIAVLALVTTNLRHLFAALDQASIPHAIAGGTLFTSDPLHQQFVLGLRAIADRNDGVAEAALLRPPFFAVDLLDLVRHRAGIDDDRAARARAARDWVTRTRRDRFARPPAQTARALLEETGIGRVAALGPNGAQRLRHLRELCIQLELDAAAHGLDYDGVTAHMRDWIEHPPQLDPPRPVGADAIQILTVHQAKGLEFPVVVLWDGMGMWQATEKTAPWRVDRDGNGWSMKTDDVQWEEPAGNAMLEREKSYAQAERRRLVYVAATRARDLLVIPKPTWQQESGKYIHAALLEDARPEWVHAMEPYIDGVGAGWATVPSAQGEPRDVDDAALRTAWNERLAAARAPVHAPTSVTALAKGDKPVLRVDEEELTSAPPRVARIGRHGPLFGDVVHHALELVLVQQLGIPRAVERAAAALALTAHLDEAAEDVQRGLTALEAAGLLAGRTLRLEYAVADVRPGALLAGYIDLVSAAPGDVAIVDFKTDRWPRGIDAVDIAFPAYVSQLRTYRDMLGADRAALLFTATGRIEWV